MIKNSFRYILEIISSRFSLVSVSLVCFLLFTCSTSAAPLRVVSYNVENLFHPEHDSLTNDLEWTPDGERRWSYTRYYRKVENIARVLTNIGEWEGVDIVGLQEVENAKVLKKLCYTLRQNGYDFVHYESPDQRGIDVALVYKKARIDTLCSRAIHVDLGEQTTRDILYVCGKVKKEEGDTLHLFVCHMPSQRGGKAESEWKREQAKRVLQHAVDSIFAVEPQAHIIVMGDMNSAPKEDINGLKNRMIDKSEEVRDKSKEVRGTHKYQGQWTCLDQFYTSPSLDSLSTTYIYAPEWIQEPDEKYLGLKPKRTFNGYRYQNGYSDHLPIVLLIR